MVDPTAEATAAGGWHGDDEVDLGGDIGGEDGVGEEAGEGFGEAVVAVEFDIMGPISEVVVVGAEADDALKLEASVVTGWAGICGGAILAGAEGSTALGAVVGPLASGIIGLPVCGVDACVRFGGVDAEPVGFEMGEEWDCHVGVSGMWRDWCETLKVRYLRGSDSYLE